MTTHPTDETPGTPRTDGFEIVVAGELPVLGNRYRMWADFARTLETELNEATKALDFNTRTLADFGKEVARLTALLRQKDEALQEACNVLTAYADEARRTMQLEAAYKTLILVEQLKRRIALTPKSPTP